MSRRRTGQRPSASSSSSRREAPGRAPRRSSSAARNVPVLKRCASAPSGSSLGIGRGGKGVDELVARSFGGGEALFRGHTCMDVLASCSSSPRGSEGYSKDAKVVVNVTVEGSPGTVRTMVRLGCSVEDAIVAVVDRYVKEGRTPRLDRDTLTGYELHHSYFSIQSLEKSERIGDVGSRSFYLRTSRNNTVVRPRSGDSVLESPTNPTTVMPPLFLVSAFIARKLGKIVRRARKLWKIVICSQ